LTVAKKSARLISRPMLLGLIIPRSLRVRLRVSTMKHTGLWFMNSTARRPLRGASALKRLMQTMDRSVDVSGGCENSG
jgi:hypothetical protein